VKDHSDSFKKYSETDNLKMLDFLIDNIYVVLVYHVENHNIIFNLMKFFSTFIYASVKVVSSVDKFSSPNQWLIKDFILS
jgi:hypothetical protein